MSYNAIDNKYNIHLATVYRLVKLYKSHGIEALKVKKHHNTYSVNEELLIIKEVFNGNSLNFIAIKYQVSYENIKRWIKNYHQLGYEGLKDKKKSRPPTMTKKKNKYKK